MSVKKDSTSPTVESTSKSADLGLERTLFSCSCWDLEHHFFVFEDKHKGEVAFEIRLNKYLPFLLRLWFGIKYIIGLDEPKYDTVLLSKENRLKLCILLLGTDSDNTKKEKSVIIPKKPRKARTPKINSEEKKV